MKLSAIVLGLTAATYSVEAARLHIRTHEQQQTVGNGEIICGERNPKNYQEFQWINRNVCPANTACVNEGYQWRCRDNSQPDGRLCGETINDLPNIPKVNWYDGSKCDQGFSCRSEGQQSRCRRSSRDQKGQSTNGDQCGQMKQGSDIVLQWKKSWLCAPGHYCNKEGAEWRCRPDAQRNGQDEDEAENFPDTEKLEQEKQVVIIDDDEYPMYDDCCCSWLARAVSKYFFRCPPPN
jgi:hypothetical protein